MDELLKLHPKDITALATRAQLLEFSGEVKEALKDIDAILAKNFNDVDYLLVRGRLLKALNRNVDALTTYNYILRLKPNNIKALIGRSLTRGNFEEALDDLNRALKINPGATDALTWRGKLMQDYKKYEDALVDYNEAIRLDPTYIQPLVGRSGLLNWLEDYEDEVKDLTTMMMLDATRVLTDLPLRIVALRKLGRNEEALKDINTMLALKPDSSWANEQRHTLLSATSKQSK